MPGRCILTGLLVTVAGCGGGPYEFAPVSGRVTLDGKPVAGAKVRLLPQKTAGSDLVGPASIGVTDADGWYSVTTGGTSTRSGAVVGTHRVVISTLETKPDPSGRFAEREIIVTKEQIPRPYNDLRKSPLLLEVPPEGTDAANFHLKTR